MDDNMKGFGVESGEPGKTDKTGTRGQGAQQPVASYPARPVAQQPPPSYPARPIAQQPPPSYPARPVAQQPVPSYPARPVVPEYEAPPMAARNRPSTIDGRRDGETTFGSLSLFSDRVVQRTGRTFRSIMLSEVDSCECTFVKKVPLLIIGCITGSIGIISAIIGIQENNAFFHLGVLFLVADVVLIILYFVTRHTIVSVNSARIRLIEVVPPSALDDLHGDVSFNRIIRFLEQIEAAKTNYQISVVASAMDSAAEGD